MNVLRLLLAIVVLSAASLSPAMGQAPEAAPVAANYTIGPKDVLTVTIFGEPDLTGRTYTVDADGAFSFPMVGRVEAAGLTVPELEEALRSKLMPDFFRNPQVAIGIAEYLSKEIVVSGEVARPGPQPYTGGLTLLGVLARAGGALPTSAGEVLVARARRSQDSGASPAPTPDGSADDGQFQGEVINLTRLQAGALELDIEIRDGDTVLVPRAESAFVLGEVGSPGAYAVQRTTTLQQLLSLAGGLSPDAASGRISIERDGQTLRNVEMNDLVLPGDTVKVPARFF